MKIQILIKKKDGVLDIEGKAIKNALSNLGITQATDVLKGSVVEVEFSGKEGEVEAFVNEICEKLLVNDVIEKFEYKIIK